MQIDNTLLITFVIAITIVILGFVLRVLNQPHVVTYIIVGVFIGPSVIGLITDPTSLSSIGSIGLVLLMFFVGMEISIPKLVSNWKIVIIGPILQIVLSFGIMSLIGKIYGWPIEKVVLFGFIIALSSTAVIIKMLHDWKELHTQIGQNIVGILIVQDIAVAPMLISLEILKNKAESNVYNIIGESVFGVMAIFLIFYIIKKENIKFPFEDEIKNDPELYIFLALIMCFGFAILASVFGLSSAFGAFLAGLLVSEGEHKFHIKKTLEPFYLISVALFFVSIGLLLNISYALDNIKIILILTFIVFIVGTILNAVILRLLGSSFQESLYGGALLSQLGEFGFVLASMAIGIGLITKSDNALLIALITCTLILSPLWIKTVKMFMKINKQHIFEIPKKITIDKVKDMYPDNEKIKEFYKKITKKEQ